MATIILTLNQTTHFVDLVQGAVTSPAGPGVPIVTNGAGLLDASFYNQGQTAISSDIEGIGNLVNLFNNAGVLTSRLATAVPGGFTAQAFCTTGAFATQPVQIAFSGVFQYLDTHLEFNSGSIGAEVFLSTIDPGGITLTEPPIPNIQQSVGYVVGFNPSTHFVAVFFLAALSSPGILPISGGGTGANTAASALISLIGGSPTTGQALVWSGSAWAPGSAVTPFTDITTGTNTTATMTVGSGASLVVTGTGVVEATELATTGAPVVVSTSAPPVAGQALVATSPTAAHWASVPPTSQTFVTTVDTGAPAPVAVGDIVMWGTGYNDDGVVRAEYSGNEVTIIGVAQTGAVAGAAITIQISGSITANTASAIDVGQLITIDPANPGRGIANSPQLQDKTPPGDAQYVAGYALAANVGTTFSLQINSFASVKYVTPGVNTAFVGSGHQVQFDQGGMFGGDSAITVEKLGGSTTLAIQQLYMSLPVVSPLVVNNAFGPQDFTTVQILSQWGQTVPVSNGIGFVFSFQNGTQSNSNGDGMQFTSHTVSGLTSNFKALHILAPASNTAPNLFTNFTGIYIDDPVSGAPFPAASPAYAIQAAGGISAFKGLAVGRVTVTTTYTALMSDQTILGNTTGGGFTITLPVTGIADGQVFSLKNTGTNTLTIASAGNIDGQPSVLLTMQNDTLIVEWDAAATTYRILKGDEASQTRTVRFSAGLIGPGAFAGPFTINFSLPFADGNYTATVSAEMAEALSSAPVEASAFQKQGTPGNGIIVWVTNLDSISHNVTVHVIARHD